jgi:hypothetical protein
MRWSDFAKRFCSRQRPNPLVTVISGLVGLIACIVMSRQTWLDAVLEIGGYLALSLIGYVYMRDARRIWRKIKTVPPAAVTPSVVEGPP